MSVEIAHEKRYSVKYDNDGTALPLIQDCVCDLQGLLAQYITVAAKKHMHLKDADENSSVEDLQERYDDLNSYLNESMSESYDITHKYLKKYFKGRSKYSSRITLKAPYGENSITDLFRKDKSPFDAFDIDDNTAFESIKNNGQYFICNDIPDAVRKEKYKNKRINLQNARQNYELPGWFKKQSFKFLGQKEEDTKWESYWINTSENRPDTESCYKSTIVIPLTLINATLSKEFKEYLSSENEEYDEDNDKFKKLMFGFLCIDHRHINYFNHGEDIRICYIIADILSLFLITRMMYTSNSRKYKKTKELLN